MAEPASSTAPKYASDMTCRFCGATRLIVRDWQRCWECLRTAETKEWRTVPTVCSDCCRRRHPAPLNPK